MNERRWDYLLENIPAPSTVIDDQGAIQAVNRAWVDLFKYPKSQAVEMVVEELLADGGSFSSVFQSRHAVSLPEESAFRSVCQDADGRPIPVRWRGKRFEDDFGDLAGPFWILIFTRGDHPEKRLSDPASGSRDFWHRSLHNGPLLLAVTEVSDGKLLEVNKTFLNVTGYTREELIGRKTIDLGIVSTDDRNWLLNTLAEKGKVEGVELHLQKKEGDTFCGRYSGEFIEVDGKQRLLSVIEDLTQARKIQQENQRTLQELQLTNRFLTAVSRMKNIKKICEFTAETLFDANPEATVVVSYYDNQVGGLRLGAVRGIRVEKLQRAAAMIGFDINQGVFDLSEDVQAYDSEKHRHSLSGRLEKVEDGIYGISFGQYPRMVCCLIEKLLNIDQVYSIGFSREEVPRGGVMIFTPRGVEISSPRAVETVASYAGVLIDELVFRKELIRSQRETESLRKIGMLISEQMADEDILVEILSHLKGAVDFDWATIQLVEDDGLRIQAVSGQSAGKGMLGKKISLEDEDLLQSILLKVEGVVVEDLQPLENWIHCPGEGCCRSWLGVPLIVKGRRLGVLTLSHTQPEYYSEQDLKLVATFANQVAITIENHRLIVEARQRMKRLGSLRKIDLAIIDSLDVKQTLEIILSQVLEQLDLDAAVVYLYDQLWDSLDYAVSQGFQEDTCCQQVSRKDPLIQEVLDQQRLLTRKDLTRVDRTHSREEFFREQGFRVYYGLPLLVKGKLVGLLEAFQIESADPDEEWKEFLIALAGQAAISIDRINLYLELKQTNVELAQAYDATIASLAKALELRDLETEGHCQRVENLTVQLAKKLGVGEQEHRYYRWGALLHDIGKIGVPDRILHKPGKLTDEEWEIMVQHPVHAYRMLSSIDYLSPALDIPLYHHERWDGSGYPEGLSGEEIPLSARVFAVVDVWDALRSDRPYREAWSDKQAKWYLQEEAGKEFDPRVVEAFLELIN